MTIFIALIILCALFASLSLIVSWGGLQHYRKLILVSALMGLLGLGLYHNLGSYSQTAEQMALQDFKARLFARLKEEPNIDVLSKYLAFEAEQGSKTGILWGYLGEVYLQLKLPERAEDAYRAALAQQDTIGYRLGLIQSLFTQHDGQITDEAMSYINAILSVAPNEPVALNFKAMAAYQREDYDAAQQAWRTLLPLVDDFQLQTHLKQAMAKAQFDANKEAAPNEHQPSVIALQIEIPDLVFKELHAEQKIFVSLHQPGQAMPLAATQLTVAELPTFVWIDDNMLIQPKVRIKDFDRLEIHAHTSADGQAIPKSGDWTMQPILLDRHPGNLQVKGQLNVRFSVEG